MVADLAAALRVPSAVVELKIFEWQESMQAQVRQQRASRLATSRSIQSATGLGKVKSVLCSGMSPEWPRCGLLIRFWRASARPCTFFVYRESP